MRRFHRLV